MKKVLIALGLALVTACDFGSNTTADAHKAKSPALRAVTEKPSGLARIGPEGAIVLEKSNYITKVDSLYDSTINGYYQVVDISLGKDTGAIAVDNFIINTSDTAVMIDSVVTNAGEYLTLNDLRGNMITKGQNFTGSNIMKLRLNRAVDTVSTSDSTNFHGEYMYDQVFSINVYASSGTYKTKLRINYKRIPDRTKSFGAVIVGNVAYPLIGWWDFRYSPKYIVNMTETEFTMVDTDVNLIGHPPLRLVKGDTTSLNVVRILGEYSYRNIEYRDRVVIQQ